MADYNFSQSYRQDLAPFSFPEGQNPLAALASGVASGAQAAEGRQKRLDDIASAEGMAGGKLTGSEKRGLGLQGNLLTDMAKGFLGAPGMEAQGRNPLLGGQIEAQHLQNQERRQSLSLMETLNQSPGGILKEFGDKKTPEEMFQFLQKNAGLNATPLGARIWGGMADVAGKTALAESRSLQAELSRLQVKDMAELSFKFGYDGKTPESLVAAKKKRAMLVEILPLAREMNVSLDHVGDWWDEQGNFDPTKATPEMAQMKNRQRASDRIFAKPEVGRYVELRDEALAAGKQADANLYSAAIEVSLGKTAATARSKAHTELATTIRQQMRAIDAGGLSEAEKASQKAVLMKQLEASRHTLLGELEGTTPSTHDQAFADELTKLDQGISELEVDLAKNPKQGLLDLGKDNRKIKLDDLKAQREGVIKGMKTAPAPDYSKYPTPESVRNAYRAGTLSDNPEEARKLAQKILREKFGMSE